MDGHSAKPGFLRLLGRPCLRGIDAVGGMTLFMLAGLGQIFTSARIFPRSLQQIYVIGYKSLFVILLIGIFCGMVLGLQGYYTLIQFGSVGMLGSAVSLTLIRELGPVLTAIFDVIGILGGYLTGVLMLGINEGAYFYRIASSVTMTDISGGFVKALVFGLLVTTVCCHQGYYTHRRRDSVGPEAVGNATTSAVVISCVLILAADYVLTSFLL